MSPPPERVELPGGEGGAGRAALHAWHPLSFRGRSLRAALPTLRGRFMRNVAILMSGTALAQGLGIAVSPFLTRLYDPAAFGLLGVFMALAAFVVTLSTLTYDLAVVLPQEDEDAAALLGLALLLVAGTAALSLILIAVGGLGLVTALGAAELHSWLWLLPLVILATGSYYTLNSWCVRREQFGRLSLSRVSRTVGTATTQVGAGLGGFLSGGLIVGFVVGQAAATFVLGLQIWRSEGLLLLRSLRLQHLKRMAVRYVDFPKYRAPHDLIYSISDQATPLLLAIFFNPVVVGLYALAEKILQVSMELLGGSIRQVFYPRAAAAYAHGIEELASLTKRATWILCGVCALPTLLIVFFGPTLFGFAFGEQWSEAGVYARFLAIYAASNFVRMPLGTAVVLLELQRFQLAFTACRWVVMLGCLGIGAYLGSAIVAVSGYVLSGACFNFGFIVAITLYLDAQAQARPSSGV